MVLLLGDSKGSTIKESLKNPIVIFLVQIVIASIKPSRLLFWQKTTGSPLSFSFVDKHFSLQVWEGGWHVAFPNEHKWPKLGADAFHKTAMRLSIIFETQINTLSMKYERFLSLHWQFTQIPLWQNYLHFLIEEWPNPGLVQALSVKPGLIHFMNRFNLGFYSHIYIDQQTKTEAQPCWSRNKKSYRLIFQLP